MRFDLFSRTITVISFFGLGTSWNSIWHLLSPWVCQLTTPIYIYIDIYFLTPRQLRTPVYSTKTNSVIRKQQLSIAQRSWSVPQWGTADAEIKTPRPPAPSPGGSTGLSKASSFSTWSKNIALHNMLFAYWPRPLAYSFLPSQFILLHLVQNLSK